MAFQLIIFILPQLQIFSGVYTRAGDGHEPFEPRGRCGSIIHRKFCKTGFSRNNRVLEDSDALDASELPLQTARSACRTARPHRSSAPQQNALGDVYCLALSGCSHAVASHSGAQQQPCSSHV